LLHTAMGPWVWDNHSQPTSKLGAPREADGKGPSVDLTREQRV